MDRGYLLVGRGEAYGERGGFGECIIGVGF